MSKPSVPLDRVAVIWRHGALCWREIADVLNAQLGTNFQGSGVANAVRRAQRERDPRFARQWSLLTLPTTRDRRRRSWFVYCRIRRIALRMERAEGAFHEPKLRSPHAEF